MTVTSETLTAGMSPRGDKVAETKPSARNLITSAPSVETLVSTSSGKDE